MKARPPGRERGMALVIGLMILVVMTLISLSAMQTTLLQERMAGAFQSHHLALQSAEAALNRAERHLRGSSLPSFAGQNKGFFHYENTDRPAPEWNEPNADLHESQVLEYAREFDRVAKQPLYYIEKVGMSCSFPDAEAGTPARKKSFRLMALGFGTNERTRVALETYYCR